MKLHIHRFPTRRTGIFLEQKVGDKIYAAEQIFTWYEMRASVYSWRTLLYLNIRNLRRFIRRSIEDDNQTVV